MAAISATAVTPRRTAGARHAVPHRAGQAHAGSYRARRTRAVAAGGDAYRTAAPWAAASGGPVLAADAAAGYAAASSADGRPAATLAEAVEATRQASVVLEAAVDQLAQLPVDELDDEAICAQLSAVDQAHRRLDARRCRLAAALAERRAARARDRARQRGQDDQRAAQRARKQLERELADQHQWTASDAKRTLEVGGQLGSDPQAQSAFDTGALPPRHAKLLADTLGYLSGQQREQASRQLLAAAAQQDAHTFGQTCRRLLAELDGVAAIEAETRRQQRRRAAITTTEDGMLALTGQWSGLDAEVLATAVDAFRSPDAAGVDRTAAQRTADAMVELARAALRAGQAPTVHGVRPHVSVTIDYAAILADAAVVEQGGQTAAQVVETTWAGPLPFAEIRRLLADAGVSRLLVDPDGVALEAGAQVREVPAGLWRALQARDAGCIAEGCDAPAGWCDVMHLEQPYHLDGRLTLDTAGLGCRHHHRSFDLYDWHVVWDGRRPRLRPPT